MNEIQNAGLVPKTLQFFDQQSQFLDLTELSMETGLPVHDRPGNCHSVATYVIVWPQIPTNGTVILPIVEFKIIVPILTYTFAAQSPSPEFPRALARLT